MTTLKIFAVLLIAVITLFETSVAQFGIPPIGAGMGGYGPVGGYGAQGGYGMGRGNYGGRGEYGIPGRGYGQGALHGLYKTADAVKTLTVSADTFIISTSTSVKISMTVIRTLFIVLIVTVALFEISLAQRLLMPSIERCGSGVNSGVKDGFGAKGGCRSNQGDLQPGIKRPIGGYGNSQGNRKPGIKQPIENYENDQGNRQPGMRRPVEDYGDNQGNRQLGIKRPIENYGHNNQGNRQPSMRRPVEDYGDNEGNRQPGIKRPIENYGYNDQGNRQPGMRRPIKDYSDNEGNRQPGIKRPIENYGNNPGYKAQQPGVRRPTGDYDASAGCGVKEGCGAKGDYGNDRRTYRGPEDYGRGNQQNREVYS